LRHNRYALFDFISRNFWLLVYSGFGCPVAQPDAPFITQAFNGNTAVFHDKWKLLVNADGSAALYDINNDPTETENLAEQYADIVARLMRRLDNLPMGESLNVPIWKVAIDPDEFGGEERRPPMAEYFNSE